MPAAELMKKMAESEDFVILDVRSREEVKVLPFCDRQVVCIPIDELRSRLEELPRKEIVVLCKTAVRAYDAERMLGGAGFKYVKFLDGGFAAWPY
ncbi:MAG: rhodanese-like domain-containing protein [Candidatus Bathyarchaeia archaeon]|jgi:rhodanese-related sulfurtransferase